MLSVQAVTLYDPVFAMDVLDYAVLSNHVHVVLRNRPDIVTNWSPQSTAGPKEKAKQATS